METTTSVDGTTIGWHVTGAGPPAVAVHGIAADSLSWLPASTVLGDDLTWHILDRRGRGRSTDTEPYDLDREVEDVVAVVTAVADRHGEAVHVFGHSFGGALALWAATRTDAIASLTVYEPPLRNPGVDRAALADRTDAVIAAGDREAAVEAFYRSIGEPRAVGWLRTIPPAWEQALRDIHTVPREYRVIDRLADVDLTAIEAPTLAVCGARSPEWLRESTRRVADEVPRGRLEVMERQGHLGLIVAAESYASLVRSFLSTLSSSAGGSRPTSA